MTHTNISFRSAATERRKFKPMQPIRKSMGGYRPLAASTPLYLLTRRPHQKKNTTLSWFHWPSLKRVPQMLPSQEGSDITSRTNKAPTAVRDSIVNSLPEREIETSNSKIQLYMVVGSSPMCFTKTKRWMESVPVRYRIDPVFVPIPGWNVIGVWVCI